MTTREEIEWALERLRRLLARAHEENTYSAEQFERAERGFALLLDATE